MSMSMSTKRFLDFKGLETYDNQMKEWVLEQIRDHSSEIMQGLMRIKATVSKEEDIPLNPEVGDVYISISYFEYYESPVEPGDLFVFTNIGWTIVQGNIDLNIIENMIPTKTSDLDNDAGYITDSDIDSIADSEINDLFKS